MGKLEIKERDALILAIGISILIGVISLIVTQRSIESLKSSISAVETEYSKALSLYRTLKSKTGSKEMFTGDILMFVQRLQNDAELKQKIVSASAAGLDNGVKISLAGLNLSQLLKLFEKIEKYKNIRVTEFTIKRDYASAQLVDVTMTLRKVS